MVAGYTSSGLPDSRISARMVPKMMPPMVAMAVSCTLNQKPLTTNLLIRSQLRKVRSRFPISVASRCAGHDEAGYLHLLFDEGEDAVDGEGRQRVQRRHPQIDFDVAGGFLLRLHGEHGEL